MLAVCCPSPAAQQPALPRPGLRSPPGHPGLSARPCWGSASTWGRALLPTGSSRSSALFAWLRLAKSGAAALPKMVKASRAAWRLPSPAGSLMPVWLLRDTALWDRATGEGTGPRSPEEGQWKQREDKAQAAQRLTPLWPRAARGSPCWAVKLPSPAPRRAPARAVPWPGCAYRSRPPPAPAAVTGWSGPPAGQGSRTRRGMARTPRSGGWRGGQVRGLSRRLRPPAQPPPPPTALCSRSAGAVPLGPRARRGRTHG